MKQASIISQALKSVGGSGVRLLRRFPGLEARLENAPKIFSPEMRRANTIWGGSGGASIGGLEQAISGVREVHDDPNRRIRDSIPDLLRRVIMGSAVGGGAGAALGRYGPDLIRKSTGRVITNLIDPYGYTLDKGHQAAFTRNYFGMRPLKPLDYVRAIIKDKPVWTLTEASPSISEVELIANATRGHHYRRLFGLEPWEFTKKYFIPVEGEKNTFMLHPQHAAPDIAEISRNMLEKFREGSVIPGKATLINQGHMGNFHVNPNGTYKDVWDVGLNKGERMIDGPVEFTRWLADYVTHGRAPTTVGQTVSHADILRQAAGQMNIHKGPYAEFANPLYDKLKNRLGAKPGNITDALIQLSPRGRADIANLLAHNLEGKRVNYLEQMAKSLGLSNQDMRAYLTDISNKTKKKPAPVLQTEGPYAGMWAGRPKRR